ncbi:MAG: 16S rRNA (guanine(527)-N(7))-methyltransferase RsmG [Candidatus Binatus sp.]
MKHKAKARPPKKKKAATPDEIAAAVRAQLAPAIAATGVVANTVEFLGRIERMAATLALWGTKINLTAHPRDPDEIVFHVFDSIIPVSIAVSSKILRLNTRLDRERRFLDIGSGAGFPGLVIAAAINAQVTLVEARRKRATFLSEVAVEMGLRNVHVECARAESLDVRDRFDLVTARAVGNPAGIFEIAGRALHQGGVLMLYVSADQKFDDAASVVAASAAGLVDGSVAGYDLRHGRNVMRRAVATWTRR